MILFFILGPILVSSNDNINHHHQPEHPHKPTLLPAHAPTHHNNFDSYDIVHRQALSRTILRANGSLKTNGPNGWTRKSHIKYD